MTAVKNGNYDVAENVEPLEDVIDSLCINIKRRHIIRMQKNTSTIDEGFILNDILTDIERIGDHSSNIAGALYDLKYHRTTELHKHQQEYKRKNFKYMEKRAVYYEKYFLKGK